jgi:hypothetical protein
MGVTQVLYLGLILVSLLVAIYLGIYFIVSFSFL